MKPLEKAWFFHVPSKNPRKTKIKSFVDENEMKEFTKELREKGRYYTYNFVEGNLEIQKAGQFSLFEGNTKKNVLHIVKYI